MGVTKDMLTRGRFAAIDSDYTELGPAELAKLQDGIDANYHDFVTRWRKPAAAPSIRSNRWRKGVCGSARKRKRPRPGG